MIYLWFCVAAVASYLLGGVNAAIIMSGLVYHEDIREKGSGNPGFTNFKRVYGNSPLAWSVMLLDILKAAVPVFLTAFFMGKYFDLWQFGAAFAGLFAMIGHCFPVWYGFKGGKAFMAGFATTWFVDWRMALIAMAVFMLVLFTLRYMSVASCTASLTCPIALALLEPSSVAVWIVCLLSALLVVIRHYPNFLKLKAGTESKFYLKSKK